MHKRNHLFATQPGRHGRFKHVPYCPGGPHIAPELIPYNLRVYRARALSWRSSIARGGALLSISVDEVEAHSAQSCAHKVDAPRRSAACASSLIVVVAGLRVDFRVEVASANELA